MPFPVPADLSCEKSRKVPVLYRAIALTNKFCHGAGDSTQAEM